MCLAVASIAKKNAAARILLSLATTTTSGFYCCAAYYHRDILVVFIIVGTAIAYQAAPFSDYTQHITIPTAASSSIKRCTVIFCGGVDAIKKIAAKNSCFFANNITHHGHELALFEVGFIRNGEQSVTF